MPISDDSQNATYCEGQVRLDTSVDWPEGTRLAVAPVPVLDPETTIQGHVIIVGFGLAGRCVADLLDSAKLPYTIVERNPVTVETQRALGRPIIQGTATDSTMLTKAGLATAAILALTIPDEEAVLEAISVARRLHPNVYIIARTNYSSKGMRASQLGADDVVKAEQAVALQFYEKLSQRIRRMTEEKQRS